MAPPRRLRILLSAFGGAGHVFPVLSLARRLRADGHEVWVDTIERWREPSEELGLQFVAAPDQIALRVPLPGTPSRPTLPEVIRSRVPLIRELRPHVVLNDFFYVPSALAAELEGVPRATLVPHPYPVNEPGMPYFLVNLLPSRTPVGRLAWRLSKPWFARRARKDRTELNLAREEVGLPPQKRLYGGISEDLGLVATYPQLEYPRRWPHGIHVTGPMLFELPHPEIELPEGGDPLVLVAASTAQDHELRLVTTAIEAFEGEPVRVLVALNQRGMQWPGPVPDNVTVVDWVSYSQVLPESSLIVTNGGHGTVVRALSEGVPLVVCPAGGDMGENGSRVAWAGAGLMIPWGLLGAGPLRWAVRRALGDRRFAERAGAIADWGRRNEGAARGAALLADYAGRCAGAAR